MNKFILEATDENLELLKKFKGSEVYWHTADFFEFDLSLKDSLSVIFDAYMDALMESEEDDEDEAIRKIGFSIGRMLVKAARKMGISSQDYRHQFNNYVTVIWTPICIWRKDESGKMRYSLMSNL
ncbi:hypothetical protein [Planktothrix mougeotii]|uniref:Uncharacterized protein n=1 Tax=Planktothrix mougeotii LEGE 06226 TaxID=1828728 RepID=A0ABR9UKK7_9CYAN|nr:hypothetical protein [Planktothrix mougeotii]MBE9146326.1 hypothetical protein [Planktothrix mougeotii LEGE 06226]